MIFFNFSVLARPAESLALRQPDPEGRKIWNLMFDKSIGRICLVLNTPYEKEVIEHWLKVEGFKPAFYEMLDDTNPNLIAGKIHRLSAVFGKAEWYVDNDPRVCAETLKLGIPTLLVASPYIVRPEWNGEKIVREWGSLVTEMDNQALKASQKSWRDE